MDDYRERTTARPSGRMAAQERERRKIEVALGYRLLAANRWGDAGDGHISARDPERPTASGCCATARPITRRACRISCSWGPTASSSRARGSSTSPPTTSTTRSSRRGPTP